MRFPTLVTYSWDVDNVYNKIGLSCGVVDRYRFDVDPDWDHILCFDANVKKVTRIRQNDADPTGYGSKRQD